MSLHQRIATLRAAGLTLAEIGKHVRLSAATVNYHLQKRGRGLPEGRGKNSHGEPPTPAEITAELAEIRGADLDRLAAQPRREYVKLMLRAESAEAERDRYKAALEGIKKAPSGGGMDSGVRDGVYHVTQCAECRYKSQVASAALAAAEVQS